MFLLSFKKQIKQMVNYKLLTTDDYTKGSVDVAAMMSLAVETSSSLVFSPVFLE